MSAISDAARLGRSIKDATLFTTTFPCHMCAKHIVASGLMRGVFLEPYPKSLAARLHSDSISIEENDRGKYRHYPAVEFEHFCGITPRRYRELFSRGKRKDGEGKFVPFGRNGTALPILDVRDPFYAPLEKRVVEQVEKLSIEALISLNAEEHS